VSSLAENNGRLNWMLPRSIFVRLFAVGTILATILLCVGTSPAQESRPLVGKWKMVSTTSDAGEVPWTLTIAYGDGKYSASVASEHGENAPKDFEVDGANVSMTVPYQGEDYEIKLKLAENKLSGTWSGNGDSGDTKGTKASGSE
jgi:hypothetical protein